MSIRESSIYSYNKSNTLSKKLETNMLRKYRKKIPFYIGKTKHQFATKTINTGLQNYFVHQ